MTSSTITPAHSSATRFKSKFLGRLSDAEFYQLCQENDHLKIERSANHEVIIMPPSVSRIGRINGKLFGYLFQWNESNKAGLLFDSSSGFTLPNGAVRAPDVSWIKKERWHQLTKEEQNSFAPIAPDFVVELMSKWDDRKFLEEKMQEYIDNGVQLGWIIDADEEEVLIYRQDGSNSQMKGKDSILDGETVLTNFKLPLKQILEE